MQETQGRGVEITALSDTEFMIDERDGELLPGGNKKIYVLTSPAPRTWAPLHRSGQHIRRLTRVDCRWDGKPIETLVGVTTDAAAGEKLKTLGITVATKTLKLDLGALLTELNAKGEFFGHDKIEGWRPRMAARLW